MDKYYQALLFDEESEYEEFIDELSEALKSFPDSNPIIHNRGIAFWEIGKVDLARADLDQAVSLCDGDITPYLSRSRFRESQSDLVGAVEDLSFAQKLDPEDVAIYRSRAALYEKQNRLKEALNDYEYAVSLEPQFAYTRMQRDKLKSRITVL